MTKKQVLAIDIGASSGRVMLCHFDGDSITLSEICRFPNEPVMLKGTLYWDVLRLFHEIKLGLIKAKKYGEIASVAVDTWGVDFGMIDAQGYLLENPVHYRDCRTEGMVEKSFSLIDKQLFYQITGNQFMDINTVFQLLAVKEYRPEMLQRTEKILLMGWSMRCIQTV